MFMRRVVNNVGGRRTWVNVLTMSLRSPFKHGLFVLVIGMHYRVHKVFFAWIIFVHVASNRCPEMRNGPLTIHPPPS